MKKIISLFTVFMLMIISTVTAFPVYAKDTDKKTVRVGWYETTYCYTDQFGRRCGMVYEYEQKIAAHTGWTYEYVEDSWPNLLQMLKNGEIDLMSDVSFTEERAESMLYSSLEMGTESYYIYIDASNDTITLNDITSFNGKKIGVNKGSVQADLLKNWVQKNKITPEIVEVIENESVSRTKVANGELDAFVTLDGMGIMETMLPVCKVGESDYYFTVNKNRPDLLRELDTAMMSIQDEDPHFNQRILDDWVQLTRTNAFLNPTIEKWLSAHGTIRIGYLDNYLPFCALDKSTGEVTGALRDYIAHATNCLKNADIQFSTKPYPTINDALDAMNKGEIDCVFPINLSSYDGEVKGLLTVAPVMQTGMNMMVLKENRNDISLDKKLTIAVDEDNINFDTFLKDSAPEWTIKYYPTVEECYKSVAKKETDAVLACAYQTNFLESFAENYKLTTVPTGKIMKFSFAVKRNSNELYSLLDKISNLTFERDMEFVLASYMYPNKKISFMKFLGDNWIAVIIVISAVFLIFLFLLSRKLKAERKVNEQQKQIEETLRRELEQQKELQNVTKKAYTDPLTGVKSKHSYLEAEKKMDQRIAEKSVSEFAIVVFDLNNLKIINDTQGHQAGDKYIKDACYIICHCFKHSPVYRVGGDEFVAILEGDDYNDRESLLSEFDNRMDINNTKGGVTIASGCGCFDSENDTNTHLVFERADEKMYQRKKQLKENK